MGYHVDIIDNFAQQVIDQRRKEIAQGRTDQDDLLSRFMTTDNEKGEKQSDRDLRDSVLNFIMAGRDTTAQVVSWLFYYVALAPSIEKKMLQEIEKYITDDVEKDALEFYNVISKMTYIHAVFYETLRLNPATPANQKYTLKDDVLPDGTHVKAGTYIIYVPYAQGRSEKLWGKDAKKFLPERWIDNEGKLKKESSSKWSAFNAGPRVCLGQNLAVLEALVCISMLLRRYSFKLAPGQTVTYGIGITFPMKDGLKMFAEKR